MRREGNKILFDSEEARRRFESTVELGDDEFMLKMLRVLEKASKQRNKAWQTVEKELEGQLEPNETLMYNYATEELRVVQTALNSHPDRSKNKGEGK